jgi:hypothetical protein
MRALVVYESMFGNTHVVADRIARGLRTAAEAEVVSVHDVDPARAASADLIVVGGPTHAHAMSRESTRTGAAETAAKSDELTLEPDAEGPGLREWFDGLEQFGGGKAAAFDTRVDIAAALSGRASKGIARRLRKHGLDLVTDPESFLVDRQNRLLYGEAERAEQWGRTLASQVTVTA